DPKGQRLLVSSVDSVGTKLKIAFMADIHSTVGIDIVSHCANDILVQGAEPLFFMDYIGIGKIADYVLEDLIKGIVDACKNIGCALLGGEIAELPGIYSQGEYDLVGFIVGAVMKKELIDGSSIKPGDSCIGIASSGLHTNGYSLTRKIIFEKAKLGIHDIISGVNRSVFEELLTPHRCYVHPILSLRKKVTIKGLAHITGGGITDNLPRIMPAGMHAEIRMGSWPILPIFEFLRRIGNIREEEMLHTYNMGIGMVVVVPSNQTTQTIKLLESFGERAYFIGNIKEKGEGVIYVQK
ncbi:MAG: phosphoribosylformylglycinamidine cyclo-ligase, partial [Candidatus Schekmanbacteria bacterium RBG_13_48_7]